MFSNYIAPKEAITDFKSTTGSYETKHIFDDTVKCCKLPCRDRLLKYARENAEAIGVDNHYDDDKGNYGWSLNFRTSVIRQIKEAVKLGYILESELSTLGIDIQVSTVEVNLFIFVI